MRVAYITTVPQTLCFFRGHIEWGLQAGASVAVITSPGQELTDCSNAYGIAAREVPMLRQISPVRDVVALARIWSALRQIRPDVVHASTPKAALLGLAAGVLARVPVRIFHVMGLPHADAHGFRRLALLSSTWVSCLLAHRVFCVSPSMAAMTRKLTSGDKLFVPAHGSPDGIDAAERFRPERIQPSAKNEFRRRLGIPFFGLVVLYMGRLVRDKGIGELAAAWKQIEIEHPDAYLVLAGNEESHDPLPAHTLAALKQSARARFCGFVEDTPTAYAAADVVVLPSYREGFGVVLAEANAMRLPVIATRVPGCVDAVADGITGTLIPPRDSGALATAMDRYLSDPKLREMHGNAGRARVLERFRPEPVREQTQAEYRRLLKQHELRAYTIAKRLFDFSLALILLVALLPLLAVLAFVVRCKLGSPVLFRQTRPGLWGQPFTLCKFRTMTDKRDGNGVLLPDSERLPALGRWLRSTSLDELPELWNVLCGTMSFVGPRPLLMEYLPRYSAAQGRRHEAKPGITGWAQINGRNSLSWDERLDLDTWYVDRRSLLLDLKILWRTARTVLRRDGIVHEGHVSMPVFLGSNKQVCND